MHKIKIMSVVGARPNFMKIAPFAHAIEAHNARVSGECRVSSDDDSQSSDPCHLPPAICHLSPATFSVFNVATGHQTSLLGLLDTLETLTGNKVTLNFSAARPGDIQHSLADISKIRKALGYAPVVELKEGLGRL